MADDLKIQTLPCPTCHASRVIVATTSGLGVACATCRRDDPLQSLPLSEQNRIRTVYATGSPTSSNASQAPPSPMQTPGRASRPASAPRKPGVRSQPQSPPSKKQSVSVKRFWLREQELALLDRVLRERISLSERDAEGRLIEVNWHEPESELARRFRSSIELRRHRKKAGRQPRTIWVKPEEVTAAITALTQKQSVPIGANGDSGNVAFFPPTSPEAQEFRAQIRVERIRR